MSADDHGVTVKYHKPSGGTGIAVSGGNLLITSVEVDGRDCAWFMRGEDAELFASALRWSRCVRECTHREGR
jgi:hypothetical protein